MALLLLSLAASALMLLLSSWNYPGGEALYRLHNELAGGGAWRKSGTLQQSVVPAPGQMDNVTVHVGVLPAMTGVSRFLELGPPWAYFKVGDLD